MMKYTKTATFLFPLLEIPKEIFTCDVRNSWGTQKFNNRFVNAYLHDESIDKYEATPDCDYVFILVRNFQDAEFDTFYSTMLAFPNYVDSYDNNECLVLVYTVGNHLQKDFDMIKRGSYSKISPEAKKLILANNFYSGKVFTLPLILNKAEVLKTSWEERLSNPGSEVDLGEQEVWPILDYPKEILTQEIINSVSKKQNLTPSEGF